MNNYAFVILAAGSSSRLGKPKQLLPFNGKLLVEHTIQAALDTAKGPVLLILGAEAANIMERLPALPISILINENWMLGMASSIHRGINALMKDFPSVDAVVLLVSDQPFVSPRLLNGLISSHEQNGKPIVASYYDHSPGVPALFHRKLFPELLALEGQEGAKKIIFKYQHEVSSILFEEGSIDIDTPADFENFISSKH